MKKYLHILIILVIFISSGTYTFAKTSAKLYAVPVNCVANCPDEGIIIYRFQGQLNFSVVKDTFFKRDDTGEQLTGNFSLDLNKSVTFKDKKTFAIWFIEGAAYDSPPADGNLYDLVQEPQTQNRGKTPIWFGASVPNDINNSVVTSNDPTVVNCVKDVCTAKKAGSTNIEITFPNSTQTSAYDFLGSENGFGKIKLDYAYGGQNIDSSIKAYSFSKITYTVTVPAAVNKPQVVACVAPDAIAPSSVRAKWTYSDPESDTQQNYQVQVSKTSNFSVIDKTVTVTKQGSVANVRNIPVTGLTPDTTYYVRVRSYNTPNSWSSYKNCASSFKTKGNQPQVVTFSAVNSITSSGAKINWTYSDPNNDAQYQYQVQVSTSSSFAIVQKTFLSATSTVSAVRSQVFTGLNANTTYYARVRAYNTVNGWSSYVSGNFKTLVNTDPLVVSCAYTGDPYIGKTLTYTSTIIGGAVPYVYDWTGSDLPSPSKYTASTFSWTYTTKGSKDIAVAVTSGGMRGTGYCGANITCVPRTENEQDDIVCDENNQRTVYSCGTTGWESELIACNDTSQATFSFNPYIADINGECGLEMTSTDVNYCTLKKDNFAYDDYFADSNSTIAITKASNKKVPIGTYSLWCTPSDTSLPETLRATKSCISNPGVKEN